MASTQTVYSDDVGEITHVSYFVPGKDTFKPEIVVINKMCGQNGVYFTEPHLLMSETMLEPYQLGQVGRYYYRYPVYRSNCRKNFGSLTDWFLKCRPNHSPTPAPKEYCGDIEMNELKDFWLIEQEASESEWRYFDVSMHTPSALLIEVLPSAHETTLQVALCPHCPKDGACMDVPYGQYGAFEDRNFMNLTRTSLGQRKMWTAVPPAIAGASYRVGVNDPDLVRLSNRWYVAVKAAGYGGGYYKIRARFAMDACTAGYGTGALVNGRGQDNYREGMGSYEGAPTSAYEPAAKESYKENTNENTKEYTTTTTETHAESYKSPAEAKAAYNRKLMQRKLLEEEQRKWGLDANKMTPKDSPIRRTTATKASAAATTATAATPAAEEHHEEPEAGNPDERCGKGLQQCLGHEFCDFSAGSEGICKACAGEIGTSLTEKGHEAFGMKCHGAPTAEAAHAAANGAINNRGAECGGSHPACLGHEFCNFDQDHVGHCLHCAISEQLVDQQSALGKKAFAARCKGKHVGFDAEEHHEEENDDETKAGCGGNFAACEGNDYCDFASGSTGVCQACGDCKAATTHLGHHACTTRCQGDESHCGFHESCDDYAGTFCNFHDHNVGTCKKCALIPESHYKSLSPEAQVAYEHKCVGAAAADADEKNAFDMTGAVEAAVRCGEGGKHCASAQFCTFHSGDFGVCRLCSTVPSCHRVMGKKGQEACASMCKSTGRTSGRYTVQTHADNKYAVDHEDARAEKMQDKAMGMGYGDAMAAQYDEQQEEASASQEYAQEINKESHAYQQEATEYENVHNEPYACPLYVDYPTLDANLGSHGQRPAVVNPFTEQCPGIDEAWCKQTHYMCDASNYGLAMKPAPAICAAMAEGWDSYGAPFGCAALSYYEQKLIYEVACDLGPGPQLYGLANAESSSPNLVAKSNYGYQYTFPKYDTPPVPCEPVHFACETPECYLSARPLGCMCHAHRVPECRMVDDNAWAHFRGLGYVHSNAYHVHHKKTVVSNEKIRGKGAYGKSYGKAEAKADNYVASKPAYKPAAAKKSY